MAANDNGTDVLQLVLSEITLMREQMASLVRYLRDKETRAVKRKNTLHTRVDKALVAKHQPTETEIENALRHQLRREANQKVRQR